jgi:lipopolysaccharide transport system permease protein
LYLRDLLWELVSRGIKIRYKGSSLGILWSLIYSLTQLFIFNFMFRSVLGNSISDYPSYIFIGVLAWSWFQSSLFQGIDAFAANRELVGRPGFPVFILPIITILTNLIDFLIAVPFLLIFVVIGGGQLTSALLFLPAVTLLQFLLTLNLSYLFAILQVSFRNIGHFLNVMLRLGFFLTPVFYDTVIVPERYRQIYMLNPIVHLLNAYRTVILEGELPDFLALYFIGGLSIVLFPLIYRLFCNARFRFLEEL